MNTRGLESIGQRRHRYGGVAEIPQIGEDAGRLISHLMFSYEMN